MESKERVSLGIGSGRRGKSWGEPRLGPALTVSTPRASWSLKATVWVKERKSLGVRVGTPPRAELADEFVEKLCVGVVSVQPRSVLGLGLGLGLELRSGLGLGAVPEQQGPITEEARR